MVHMYIFWQKSGPAMTISYLNENDKVLGVYCQMWLHQYSNNLEVDLLKQERPGFELRTSAFKTDCFTIVPPQLSCNFLIVPQYTI